MIAQSFTGLPTMIRLVPYSAFWGMNLRLVLPYDPLGSSSGVDPPAGPSPSSTALGPSEEPEGVIPGDVLVGVGLPCRLVDGRLAGLQDLAEVVGKQVPAEEVVVLAVRAVDDDTLDASRGENRLEGVDIDEVLLKSFPLL